MLHSQVKAASSKKFLKCCHPNGYETSREGHDVAAAVSQLRSVTMTDLARLNTLVCLTHMVVSERQL